MYRENKTGIRAETIKLNESQDGKTNLRGQNMEM